MPRGRPPIQRSEEEAKIARRAQVRRNVQAYRLRKHSNGISGESQVLPKEPFSFVFEEWGQDDFTRPLDTNLNTPPEQQYNFTRHDGGRRLVDHSCKINASSEINQNSPMFRKLNLLAEIPPEINAARPTAFLPTVQNGDPLSLETGPHWAQLIPDLVNTNDVLDSTLPELI